LKTKHSRHPDKTTAAQKAQAKRDADPDPTTLRRFLCTQFKFWHVCTRKACRRALKCSGDPHACFALYWPHVPEQIKILYRAGIKARCAGLSPREAARVAIAEVVRWRELEKQYGAARRRAGAGAQGGAGAAGVIPQPHPQGRSAQSLYCAVLRLSPKQDSAMRSRLREACFGGRSKVAYCALGSCCQMTCVNISKTTTTNGTPSSHSSSGIVRLHFPKHWNRNVSALPMFHWIDRTPSLSSDPTGGALSAKRRRPSIRSDTAPALVGQRIVEA